MRPAPERALAAVEFPEIRKRASGKVREIFELDDRHLLIVATDRISAFDCILPTPIPDKGRVLTALSAWWFERTRDIVPNHLVSTDPLSFDARLEKYGDLLEGRAMVVNRATPFPVECVVRGYLSGSGWKDYRKSGVVCGVPLREGYRFADKLDAPIFSPATKAVSGHDENISFERVVEMIGRETAYFLRDHSLAIYAHAARLAEEKGIIIADTKFEFGRLEDGRIILIDELLTPDSSRFWPADSYQPGSAPVSFDKQFVRDYLESTGWDKTPPAPPLPEEIVARTRAKYIEAYERITGKSWTTADQ
ncbi:MAG TPA: phosphoribosylaminoimidazolesuccinocarboxamide synthase [Kiritimatiellae bacterium]|nr:phosphoribosylaminoimidazolesuccinocarboxamide synthase [Kiritimatiellia bacterium]